MKKLYTLLVLVLSLATFAQSPEGFNYQATVRNSAGALITNKNVGFTFKIIKDSPTGSTIYSETRTVMTDDLGSVNLIVGKGTPSAGTFSAVDWGSGNFYLGIEINTGSGNVAMGTTQLLSVPYALYAKSAGLTPNSGRVSVYIQGNITDQQAAAQIAQELGSMTENIYVKNTTGLTTLDFSKLTKGITIDIERNKDLVSLNFNGLTTVADELDLDMNPSLVSVSLPVFSSAGYLSLENNALKSLNLPAFSSGSIATYSSPSLTSLSLPKFASGRLNIQATSLVSLSLPAYTQSSEFYVSNNKSLTSINIPLLTAVEGSFNASNNALSSSEINKLLNLLNSKVTVSNQTITLNHQTPVAPPTGQGLIDQQSLLEKGFELETDVAPASLEIVVKEYGTAATIAGATVKLHDDYNTINQTLISDANGKVKFTGLDKSTNYSITASIDCRNNDQDYNNRYISSANLVAGGTVTFISTLSTTNSNMLNVTNNSFFTYSIAIAPSSDPSQISNFEVVKNSEIARTLNLGDYILTTKKLINGSPSTVPADTVTKNVTISCGNITQISVP